jgi:hypothetical protein
MSELTEFLKSVDLMAKSQLGGSAKVRQLLEDKIVLPALSATKNLAEWQGHRALLGEIEFRQLLFKLQEKPLRQLAKRIDKHALLTAESSVHEVVAHVEGLADGSVSLAAAPVREKKKKDAIVVPDLRAAYRSGGNDQVYPLIASLDAKTLKAAVEAQNLKAEVAPGRTADGWRKYIQVALKEELGSRGDAIGELSRLAPETADD